MSVLLPRLSGPAAEFLLDQLLDDDDLQWQGFDPTSLPEQSQFSSTGGTVATARSLQEIRDGILSIARENGFGEQDTKHTQANFDASLATWLAQQSIFMTGEALRDDVWSFVGVVIAPDVVHWRFGKSRHRYIGGVRNAFQRLWIRARALDRGDEVEDRWGLIFSLTEDALVQIAERPSIGADSVLATALAEAWVRASNRLGRNLMEDTMRLATLRVRIRNEIQSLSLHPELSGLLDEIFDGAAATITSQKNETIPEPRQMSERSDRASVRNGNEVHGASDSRKKRWSIWGRN